MSEHKDTELLIGYVLEALEEEVAALVASRLQTDRQFLADYHRLMVFFRPLLASRETEISRVNHPTGLAAKTLAFLQKHTPLAAPVPVQAGHSGSSDTLIHRAVSYPEFPNYQDSEESADYLTEPADAVQSPETVSASLSDTRVSSKNAKKKWGEPEPVAESLSESQKSPCPASETRETPSVRRFRGMNLFVSIFLLGLVAFLALPMILSVRDGARMLRCQTKMKEIGMALHQYSTINAGFFPSVKQMPNPAHRVAGIYAPILMESQNMKPQDFLCPAVSGGGNNPGIPALSRFVSSMDPMEKEALHRSAGGDYAYNIGYTQNGVLYPPRDLRRPTNILLADAPQIASACSQNVCNISLEPPARNSHGNLGINLLHEDGHVSTVPTPEIVHEDGTRDLLFLNNDGKAAPGIDDSDIVLGRSELFVKIDN